MVVRKGSLKVESCEISSVEGTGVVASMYSEKLRMKQTQIGPCGRHGVVTAAKPKKREEDALWKLFLHDEGEDSYSEYEGEDSDADSSRSTGRGDVVLEEVSITDCKQVAVAVNELGMLELTKCTTENCRNAVTAHPANVKIEGSSFKNCTGTAILAYRVDGHESDVDCHVRCTKCCIDTAPLAIKSEGASSRDRHKVIVEWGLSNTIRNCKKHFAESDGGEIQKGAP